MPDTEEETKDPQDQADGASAPEGEGAAAGQDPEGGEGG